MLLVFFWCGENSLSDISAGARHLESDFCACTPSRQRILIKNAGTFLEERPDCSIFIPSILIFGFSFQEMSVIVVGTGCIFSLIFHAGTKEPRQTVEEKNKGKRQPWTNNKNKTKKRCASLYGNDKLPGCSVRCLRQNRHRNLICS